MTSSIYVIIVLLMTPAGPRPLAPHFIYPSWAACEATRAIGDEMLRASGNAHFLRSYCIELKGAV